MALAARALLDLPVARHSLNHPRRTLHPHSALRSIAALNVSSNFRATSAFRRATSAFHRLKTRRRKYGYTAFRRSCNGCRARAGAGAVSESAAAALSGGVVVAGNH